MGLPESLRSSVLVSATLKAQFLTGSADCGNDHTLPPKLMPITIVLMSLPAVSQTQNAGGEMWMEKHPARFSVI